MSDPVLFQMWSGYRAHLIEKHEFYVAQAKSRLLAQFNDAAISAEADEVEAASWEERGKSFDPDWGDPADGVEEAFQDGVWRYQLLTELRDNVRLSIAAGIFHTWEKTFRQWLVDEIRKWHTGEEVNNKVWRAPVDDLYLLLERFGWQLRTASWFPAFDACRLVVNVYKHGDGPSLQSLYAAYPQFLVHPLTGIVGAGSKVLDRQSHEHLSVTDADLDAFANAITQFWIELPENVFRSQVFAKGTWLVKAIEADRKKAAAK